MNKFLNDTGSSWTTMYTDVYEDLYKNGYHPGGPRGDAYNFEYYNIDISNYDQGNILDIGCGYGYYLENIKKQTNLNVYGIDPSTTAIQSCIEKGLTCVVGSITNTPYDDNYFDVIHSSDVLEHLHPDDRIKALKEIYRILKDDGTFYANISTTYESHVSHKNIVSKWKLNDLHIQPLSAEQWTGSLQDTGFNLHWHEVYTRERGHPLTPKGCRCKEDGFTEKHGQCHIKLTCTK